MIDSDGFRPNVGIILTNDQGQVLWARRVNQDAWQFPQGGINEGETPKDALFRELKEEIGTNKIDIIAEYPEWISYDYPDEVIKRIKPKFDGQIQRYYLVRLRDDKKINLDTKEPEFDAYKFSTIKEALEAITPFKKDVYKTVLGYFIEKGYI